MGFFGNSSIDQPQTEANLIMSFLREMAMAQNKRFEVLGNQIEELRKEVLRLQEMQKNAVVAPSSSVEVGIDPKPAAQPVSEPQVQVSVQAESTSAIKEPEVVQRGTQKSAIYPPLIYGSPDGAGFEASDNLSGRDDNRALYVVERISETEARFYPLADRFHRLRSNASSFFLPLCNVSGDLDNSTTFEVLPKDYGKLKLTDGYWEMTEKCSVNCL